MRIGFIGTGIMGTPMASRLQAAGHDLLLVKHRSTVPPTLIANGATVHASPRDVATLADIVILMLPDTAEVEHVLFGVAGACETLRAGKVVIDMSSIDPFATRDFAARVAERGAAYVDAPVSGGEIGARAGTLSIMCGAHPAMFARIRPVLSVLGESVTLIGEVGAGQIAKVANQIIVALNIAAVAEALVFADKAGADVAKVRWALSGGFAASRVLEVHGERMMTRAFNPGGRIRTHQKDLDLALAGGRALGVALPATSMTQQMFSACVARGDGDNDHAALVRAVETLARHEMCQLIRGRDQRID